MDELIKSVTEKAGINPEQAKSAVNTVIDFLKAKMPGIGEKIAGMLSGGGDAGGAGGGVGDVLGGLKGKFGL